MKPDFVRGISGAVFSDCRQYRYALWRRWGGEEEGGRFVAFVGLNPSTATEWEDDPTIRRCVDFAKRWGMDGLLMLNIFAFRATDPNAMKVVADPVGPDNDAYLRQAARQCDLVVAAWGVHGDHRGRGAEAVKLLPPLHVLKLTQAGHPGHPLYLPAILRPTPWPASITCFG